jgi:hypothetical protein
MALAKSLKVNTSVTTVWLDNNRFSNAGALALVKVLKLNMSVTTIWLDGNQISTTNLSVLRDLTDRNKRLGRLFLFDARRMLLSVMCADECGVVWPYLLEHRNIIDGVAVPDDIDALRATFAAIVAKRRRRR